jgi:septum formation topological specificity factor MinE
MGPNKSINHDLLFLLSDLIDVAVGSLVRKASSNVVDRQRLTVLATEQREAAREAENVNTLRKPTLISLKKVSGKLY